MVKQTKYKIQILDKEKKDFRDINFKDILNLLDKKRKETIVQVEKMIDNMFYIPNNNQPIVSVQKVIELKQKLEKMKNDNST